MIQLDGAHALELFVDGPRELQDQFDARHVVFAVELEFHRTGDLLDEVPVQRCQLDLVCGSARHAVVGPGMGEAAAEAGMRGPVLHVDPEFDRRAGRLHRPVEHGVEQAEQQRRIHQHFDRTCAVPHMNAARCDLALPVCERALQCLSEVQSLM